MEKYIDYDLCKKCGGVCCKENGCVYLTRDFKSLTFKQLVKLLDKGNISISGQPFNGFYNDGWSYMLYLRARNQHAPLVDLITQGGPCKLLGNTGCKLSEEKRPSCGLLVKPTKIGGPCEKIIDNDAIVDWLNYNGVLSKLVKHYTNKDVLNVLLSQIKESISTINEKRKNSIKLTNVEKQNEEWYYNYMVNKPYYNPEEVKMIIKKNFY